MLYAILSSVKALTLGISNSDCHHCQYILVDWAFVARWTSRCLRTLLHIFLACRRLQQQTLGSCVEANSVITETAVPERVIEQLQKYANLVGANDNAAQALFEKIIVIATQPRNLSSPQQNLQNLLAHEFYSVQRSQLFSHTFITSKDQRTQQCFRSILESTVCFGASSWLLALPNGGLSQRMTPLEAQAAFSLRLLMPQFEPDSKCAQNKCNAPMDKLGYHSLNCRGHLLSRHNIVRDALFDLCLKAGFNPVKDAPVACLGSTNNGRIVTFRPADLQISGDDFTHDCIDITVVSPIKLRTIQSVIGKYAEDAEAAKYTKHAFSCEQSGYGFKAFAIDVFGVMAKKSYQFLQRIISGYSRMTGIPVDRAASICLRRISFAVQLGVARQIVRCRQIDDQEFSLVGNNSLFPDYCELVLDLNAHAI